MPARIESSPPAISWLNMGHYSIDKKRCQEHKIEISETPVIIFPSRFVAPEAEQMMRDRPDRRLPGMPFSRVDSASGTGTPARRREPA